MNYCPPTPTPTPTPTATPTPTPTPTPTATPTPTPTPTATPYPFVAHSQEVSTTVGSAVTITLTRSGPEEESIGWGIVGPVTGGTVEYVPGSKTTISIDVVFTPFEGFVGTASFQFVSTDGPARSNAATVTVNVDSGTPTPVAPGQPATGTTSDISAAPGISTWGLAGLAAVMLLVTALAVGRASGSRRAT